jgi:antitoxin MazE
MRTRVAKWGNSLGVRLPKDLASDLHLEEGSEIELTIRDGALVARPAGPRYTLADLLVGMTPDAVRAAFEWGPDVGRERVD